MVVGKQHILCLGIKRILFLDGDAFPKSRHPCGLGNSHLLRQGQGHQKDSAKLNVSS